MSDEIGIGTVLYVYEDWRRHVDGDTPAKKERARYRPHAIAGETRGTWVLADNWGAVNKRTLTTTGRDKVRMYTAQQVEDRIWHHLHRHAIVRRVAEADTATLKQIAALLGYVSE